MEEEIDLRGYLAAMLHRWWWIVGLALLAATGTLVASLLLPAVYEARALAVVTQPRYQMQFDPRFETTLSQTPAYKAFPTLATSDGVLLAVVEGYTPTLEAHIANWDLRTLSPMVKATSEGDPSLIALRVRSRSARDAAAIANVWVDTLVRQANRVYGENEADVGFFEAQVAQASAGLGEADAALIEFQARNEAGIVGNQLASQQQAHADYLAAQRAIATITQDAQGLRDQLAREPSGQPASLADSLTALLLQIKAFNAQSSTPVQIQINSAGSLSDKSLAEQIAFLDGLAATLQARSAEIDTRLAELEPQILETQRKLQKIQTESDRLTGRRDQARETYLTLSRKLDEARIAAQEQSATMRVGSYAVNPGKPAGPRRLYNTMIAGVLGLAAGAFLALAIDWWKRPSSR